MKKRKKKNKVIPILIICLLVAVTVSVLYDFNLIPHKSYSNKDFDIDRYYSSTDNDGDGIDDQTDILQNVRAYISTEPQYKSKYYETGYPNDEYGVCTDVVAFGMLGAGYDLKELVNEDINNHREDYNIDSVDKNIDFRRVRNLIVYFNRNAISLTTDVHDIDQWQGGDIVVFDGHIGIVSDKRNRNGVPFLIHNGSPYQKEYEQDVLETRNDIVGHFRIS